METFRKTDLIFRYGGEEFVALLTETPLEKALIPLERLRSRIENYPFKYNHTPIKITVSIGVNANKENIETASEFLDSADRALYQAKNTGRNRVVTT